MYYYHTICDWHKVCHNTSEQSHTHLYSPERGVCVDGMVVSAEGRSSQDPGAEVMGKLIVNIIIHMINI